MIFPLFLIPVLVGLIAQLFKRWLNQKWLAQTTIKGLRMPRYGGMPSAHTAFAFSLLTVVALTDGFSSTTFAIAAAITIFIVDDALRMRILLGRQGHSLYRLIKKLPPAEQSAFPPLETRLGHNIPEALAGAVLGVAVTIFIYWLIS
jgi:uncharacterized protein